MKQFVFCLVLIVFSTTVFAAWSDTFCGQVQAHFEFTNLSAQGQSNSSMSNSGADHVDGKIGKAYDFERGNSDYLSAGDHAAYSFGTGAFTLSYWLKVESIPGSQHHAINKFDVAATSTYEYETYLTVSSDRFYICDTSGGCNGNGYGTLPTVGTWHHFAIVYSGTAANAAISYYRDGVNVTNSVDGGGHTGMSDTSAPLTFGARKNGATYDGHYDGIIDEVTLLNTNLPASNISFLYNSSNGVNLTEICFPTETVNVPVISGTNCTSCNAPLGDTSAPYTTADTTPTFTFSTSEAANCRVARTNISYSSMGSSRNCTSGEGTTSHTCTVGVADELIFPYDTVYATCVLATDETLQGNASFQMEIENLDENSTLAILNGIHASSIWPGASVYADQQVTLTNATNYQLTTRVDYSATYGNQMWLFNYENTSAIGLFNMSPAVYVLDMVNISLTEIKNRVEALINSTKE